MIIASFYVGCLFLYWLINTDVVVVIKIGDYIHGVLCMGDNHPDFIVSESLDSM